MLEKSCGTIPYTIKDGIVYYLLLKSKDGRHCNFPKGHVEGNETEKETAIRETFEETSVKVEINSDFRYVMRWQLGNGNQKDIAFFLGEFKDQEPKRNENFEDFDYLLLPFERALDALTVEESKKMLAKANDLISI